MTDRADTSTSPTPTPDPASSAPVDRDVSRQPSPAYQVLAWVGIAAGAVFIVAVVFFSGFIIGKHSGPGYSHLRGHDGPHMVHPGGPPPMGPAGEWPGPGRIGPGGPMGPPTNPGNAPTTTTAPTAPRS